MCNKYNKLIKYFKLIIYNIICYTHYSGYFVEWLFVMCVCTLNRNTISKLINLLAHT